MNARRLLLTLAPTVLLVASACAPAADTGVPTPPPAPAGFDRSSEPPSDQPDPTSSPAAGGQPTQSPAIVATAPAGTAATTPQITDAPPQEAWRTVEMVDARSGETLTINDLSGQLVIIEPMAIWCSSCRFQQNEVRKALESLGREGVVFISLDVDPNESEPALARYADELGFSWQFVVATRELSRSLADTFGVQVLSPPSTPKIVIDPDGKAEVSFGIKRAAELEADFTARLP